MDEQERDLEQLLARTNSLLKQYSVAGEIPVPPRIAALEALRDGLDQELTRYRVRAFLSTLRP